MNRVAKLIATIEEKMDDTAPTEQANPEHLRMVEALLFAAAEPLDVKALATSLPDGADVPGLITALQAEYEKRGVNLCCVAGKYQFRTAMDLAFLLRKERLGAQSPMALPTPSWCSSGWKAWAICRAWTS